MDEAEEQLAKCVDWHELVDGLRDLGSLDNEVAYAFVAALWSVISRTSLPRELRVGVAAPLYYWLERTPPDEDSFNVVWSIASRIYDKPYSSEWNPKEDPEIADALGKLRASGGPFR